MSTEKAPVTNGKAKSQRTKAVKPAATKPKAAATKPKVAAAKPRSDKPTYVDMIVNCIRTLKEHNGSSRHAILKFISSTYNIDSKVAAVYIKYAIRKGMEKGLLKYGRSE